MIQLQNLNKIYPHHTKPLHTLKDISLHVNSGEILALIGKSGAGKSTLLRCVNLLEKPSSGHVYINDIDLMSLTQHRLRKMRHDIGMVFQHFNLLSRLNVFENVAFPLRLLKTPNVEIKQKVDTLLEKVGLLPFTKSYPHQLSGGQKQRVAIARALATSPSILLCDEMTSALDPETTQDILTLIKSLHDEYQLSILVVTHEMPVAKSLADTIAVIDQGEIVECAPTSVLFKNPQSVITKRLVQSTFKNELPDELISALHQTPTVNDHAVLRFTFAGDSTFSPMINEWIKQTAVEVSILQANIEKIKNETIGSMIVSVQFTQKELQQEIQWLQEKGLIVEVLGYVNEHDWFALS